MDEYGSLLEKFITLSVSVFVNNTWYTFYALQSNFTNTRINTGSLTVSDIVLVVYCMQPYRN